MTKWVTKKLGEIASLQGGFAFQSKDFADDGIPLIRIGDITAKGLNTNNSAKLPSYFLDEHTEFAIKADDTIIAMSGATVGKCTLVTEKDIPALLNQRVGRFKVKNGIDKKFVYYTVSNYSYQQKLLLDAIGGAQPNVSPRQIESVLCSIPIKADGTPDLSEQRRIAGILSSADRAIAASEALIEKYRNIKRGLLTTLLQPKEGWKKVKLGEVGKLVTGLTYSPNNVVDEGVLVLRSSNIQNDNICLEDNVYVNVTEYNPVQEGDVLICVRNGSRALIGKTARINKEVDGCAFGAFMAIYRSEYNDLLYHFFKSDSFFSQVSKNIGATINSINGSDLKEMEVYLPYKNGQPDLSEQRRIAKILSSVDAKIAAEEKVVEKYKGVKKGLMEELLKSEK